MLFDASLENANHLACGGNKAEYHYIGLDIERDIGNVEYFDFAKIVAGGICPECGGATLSISRGVEVIYDDRAVSAGVMFSDADLLGIPLRIIVSP